MIRTRNLVFPLSSRRISLACSQLNYSSELFREEKNVSNPSNYEGKSISNNLSLGGNSSTRTFSTINSPSFGNNHDQLIVVGSGVAGCSTALVAAETYKVPVTLLHAGSSATDCNSYWAQGGIIYRNYDPVHQDSAAELVKDIHRAGAGLCQDDAVWKVAEEGPDRVRQLLLNKDEGNMYADVPFDRLEDGNLSCCLEASHSAPRIIHYADQTGKIITDHITAAAMKHPLITVVPDSIVTDIVTVETSDQQNVCIGTEILNKKSGEEHTMYGSYGTVLTSGGLGGIYQHSTNPAGFNALGSSVALALRAGAKVADLEYVQFHPTALCIENEPRFLISEALRGEGAILRDSTGRAFAKDFHEDGELAPRDIVARGVFNESRKSSDGMHNVFLDITHRDAKWLKSRFPSIDAHLSKKNLDITKDQLPITPAAHYTCGGVTTDLHGRTNIKGLYSAGEAARTGLHGGNRLASTSLLEGLVFGASVSDFVGKEDEGKEATELARESILALSSKPSNEMKKDRLLHVDEITRNNKGANDLMTSLKKTMWDDVGITRNPSGLNNAMSVLGNIREEACHLFDQCATQETAALRDASYAGEGVAKAALGNSQSAGAHFMSSELDDLEDEDDSERMVAN